MTATLVCSRQRLTQSTVYVYFLIYFLTYGHLNNECPRSKAKVWTVWSCYTAAKTSQREDCGWMVESTWHFFFFFLP